PFRDFSFFAVVVTALVICVGSTQGEDQFTATAREMMRIYGGHSVSKATKQQYLNRLANFYEHNRQRIQFTAQERHQADELLARYQRAKASTVLVDGVPAQGGAAVALLLPLAVEGATQLVKLGINHFTSSAGGVEINRGVAIFGLAFIMMCFFFRSKSL
ncbi:hypothetical protein KR200_001020, partial [Drosophila serrata]